MSTKINWCDETWNPVSGCTPAGVGCAHCYAKRVAERFPAVHGVEFSSKSLTSTATRPVPFSCVLCHPERLSIPEHWRKPRAIMCPSMGDLFHQDVPLSFIRDVLGVMDRCLQHTFIVLTKRPERAREVLGDWTKVYNLVLGVSCSTQEEADRAIPILLDTRANRRIVSLEPLVEPVGLSVVRRRDGWNIDALRGVYSCHHDEGFDHPAALEEHDGGPRLDGVIVGGESGPGARPMHPDWVRLLRNQCECAGVPFFFKQWGEWAHGSILRDSPGGIPLNLARLPHLPCAVGQFARVGLRRAGRILDGRTLDALCWDTAGRARA